LLLLSCNGKAGNIVHNNYPPKTVGFSYEKSVEVEPEVKALEGVLVAVQLLGAKRSEGLPQIRGP
jgi:hypothetical protein